MQRTIKFRVWDKTLNKIHCWSAIENHFTFEELLDDNFFEAMQYTGLKDKNDIEIYEGDIILVNVFMSKHVTGLVAFDRGSFCVTGNFEGWGYDCNTTNFWEMSTNGNEYKVIGNIYENPELAK